MAGERVRGQALHGNEPQRLELSDGSRLLLDCQEARGPIGWRRLGERRGPSPARRISVPDAVRLAGEKYAGYIRTRTRAEVEWMRAVADWYRDEATRLSDELRAAGAR